MKSVLLPASADTLKKLDHMLLAPHVHDKLDSAFVGYWNVYRFFNLVMAEEYLVFGSFDDADSLLGLCWGRINDDLVFEAYGAAYERHVDVATGIRGCIGALWWYCPDCQAIECYLPEDGFNRAMRLCLRRLGFCNTGKSSKMFTDRNEKIHWCERYVLPVTLETAGGVKIWERTPEQ